MAKSLILAGLSLLVVSLDWLIGQSDSKVIAQTTVASSINLQPNSSNINSPQSQPWLAQTEPGNNSESTAASLEAQIIAEINRARTNPGQYAEWLEAQKLYYRRKFLKLPDAELVVTEEGVAALEAAIELFQELEPLPPIENTQNLNSAAQDYLRDSLRLGGVEDSKNSLTTLAQRYGITGEIVQSSISTDTTAEYLVMQLILDDGVEGRIHQENLLDSDLVKVGVACQNSSSGNQRCLVMQSDLADANAQTPDNQTDSEPVAAVSEPEAWLRQGVLENGDEVISSDGSLYDVYQIDAKAGESYVITLESQDFDTFLAISDAQNEIIEQNDDIDSNNSNSQLTVTVPEDGTYKIIVNSYQTTGRGRYTLKIDR